MSSNDQLQRFIFEESDIRGEIITLTDSYQSILNNSQYPAYIAELMGEFLAAAGLLSATMKFDGIITIQARGDGDLSLIMADCTKHHQLRSIATFTPESNNQELDLKTLLNNGHLAITINPTQGQRYQGLVPLEDSTLSGCIEGYFQLSEQLPTHLWLFADGSRATGLLLQALPAKFQSLEERDQYWQHISTLASTISREEMLSIDPQTLLQRLFHQEKIRLFEPQKMHFGCSCSQSRSADMLVSLGKKEAVGILEEKGEITIDCQFCHQQYTFDHAQIEALFPEHNKTIH